MVGRRCSSWTWLGVCVLAVSWLAQPVRVSAQYLCTAGSNDGNSCQSDTDCPSGSCVIEQGVCNGGTDDGLTCDCPGGTCSATGTCSGGDFAGESCDTQYNCTGGNPCVATQKLCFAGDTKGFACLNNSQCPGSICCSTGKYCNGGTYDSYSCVDTADCSGGGTCTGEAGNCGVVAPTATLTRTPTRTRTAGGATATATPTPTRGTPGTATRTPTPTVTGVASRTPSRTATRTPTVTPTSRPTATSPPGGQVYKSIANGAGCALTPGGTQPTGGGALAVALGVALWVRRRR